MGSNSSFYNQNSTVYTVSNPSGPASAPQTSPNNVAPSSFYGGNGTVYTTANPSGPGSAPQPSSTYTAPSSFYSANNTLYTASNPSGPASAQQSPASYVAPSSFYKSSAPILTSMMEANFSLGVSIPGSPLKQSEWLFGYTFDFPGTFAANLAGSFATAGIAALNPAVISVRKNGVEFCTLKFTGKTGAFSAPQTSFVVGDLLEMVAPSIADPTLAELSITLFGTRN